MKRDLLIVHSQRVLSISPVQELHLAALIRIKLA